MKKILIVLLSFFLLTGCDLAYISPSTAVTNYMNKYKNNSKSVIEDLNEYLKEENYSNETLENYREVYLRQYTNLKYEIIDEIINENDAFIKVNITVYDYYKTNQESSNYFLENQEKFMNTNGDINLDKYLNYKIKKLLETEDRVSYTIELKLKKHENLWTIEPLDEDSYEKIHGIYEYNEQ